MKDPGFWVRANVFYDCQHRYPTSGLERLLLHLVFIRRQEEKLAAQTLLVGAINQVKGETLQALMASYVKAVFPFMDVEGEADRAKKALLDELTSMSKQTLVFDIPRSAAQDAPKGVGQHVMEALQENKKRAQAATPAQIAPGGGQSHPR